jgi:hypothetical protein
MHVNTGVNSQQDRERLLSGLPSKLLQTVDLIEVVYNNLTDAGRYRHLAVRKGLCCCRVVKSSPEGIRPEVQQTARQPTRHRAKTLFSDNLEQCK